MAACYLCNPRPDLACFACCPPIRPAGYDHLDHRSSLTRLLRENRAEFLAGRLPVRESTGLWCPGLGFLEPGERLAGCLLHPARNQGQDLRGPTGYQEKCAREFCIEARAWADLGPELQAALLEPCTGMDSFVFSSRRANPLMRWLGLGPETAAAAMVLGGGFPDSLDGVPGWQGWLLARLAETRDAAWMEKPEAVGLLKDTAQALVRALSPPPPLESGQPLAEIIADPWEARFWRMLLGRRRARPAEVERWREALTKTLGN